MFFAVDYDKGVVIIINFRALRKIAFKIHFYRIITLPGVNR